MMKTKEIILVGGGAHCNACIDVIEAENKFKIAGIVDVKEKLGRKVLNYEITATDADLPKLAKQYKYFFITIGQVKNPAKRIEKFEYLNSLGVEFPVIVSPFAYLSKYAFVGEGTILMHNAFINANVNIGKNCIINTAAIIEHDVKIEDNCHISTGCILNGSSKVEERVFIGSNTVVADKLSIVANTVIGAGSTVIKSITDSGIYVGSPARKITKDE